MTPPSYSIRSNGGGTGFNHPKSWVLEVSNDGSDGSWAVVDSRKSNSDMNDQFAIANSMSGAFRFVRLRQTGKNHKGNNHLDICALELFGACLVPWRLQQQGTDIAQNDRGGFSKFLGFLRGAPETRNFLQTVAQPKK